MRASRPFRTILLVQWGDIGDLALTLSAIGMIRAAYPHARIELITTPAAARILPPGLLDRVYTHPRRIVRQPRDLLAFARTLAALWRRFDAIVFFHHMNHRFGVYKYALVSRVASRRSTVNYGIEQRGAYFLTHRVPNLGFGTMHQTEYWHALARLAGADGPPLHDVRPYASPEDRAWAAGLPRGAGPRIVFHAGGGDFNLARRWKPAAFAQTAALVYARALEAGRPAPQVVVVGGRVDDSAEVCAILAAEYPAVEMVDLVEATTLTQLTALLETADAFLGADSGVMHLAAAAGTRVVALFGATNAGAWQPYAPGAIVLRTGVECSPCSYVGNGMGAHHGCAPRTCMRRITPEMAADALGRVLAEGRITAGPASAPAPYTPLAPVANPPERTAPTLDLLGVPVSRVTYAEWMSLIAAWVAEDRGRPRHVCTVNPEFIMIAGQDAIFTAVLTRCALAVPDGVGLLWAARWVGAPLAERVTGSDGLVHIAEHAARHGWKLFFLGAAEGVADRAADVLRARFPGLRIVGTASGSPAGEEEDHWVRVVNSSGADLLFVAYGAPEQDKWIARNLPHLRVKMAMGVGGSFDFIAGIVPRAPERWRALGIEWLYRLILQPWRLKRMMRLPRFVLAVLRRHPRGSAVAR